MNLSFDYDGTYTRDPEMWHAVLSIMRKHGHKVYLVTMRYEASHESKEVTDALHDKVDAIFFTGRKAKAAYMASINIRIDVWLDDNPHWILIDAKE